MSKRVFIIHGWDGHPAEGWFPWLKQELAKLEYCVTVPQLPFSATPRIGNWITALQELIISPDENTFFIGHSMGCQAIARYLEKLPENTRVGGAIFVAGFFDSLTNLEEPMEVAETVKHWLDTPINLKKVRIHLLKSVAIFSDDDPWVPLSNQHSFARELSSEIMIIKNAGHFSGSRDGTIELPIVLDTLLKI